MTAPQDTSTEAWDVQVRIYRRMASVQRLNIALELTEMSRTLLGKGLEQQHPEYSEKTLRSETVRLWLGDDVLYRRLQKSLVRAHI